MHPSPVSLTALEKGEIQTPPTQEREDNVKRDKEKTTIYKPRGEPGADLPAWPQREPTLPTPRFRIEWTPEL